MNAKRLYACTVVLFLACGNAHAESWFEYYETGTCVSSEMTCTKGATIWDKRCTCSGAPRVPYERHYLDVDSIRPENKLLRYRTKIVNTETGRSQVFDMIADCATKTRGQLPSRDLYDTFPDTIGGAELKVACMLEQQKRRGT